MEKLRIQVSQLEADLRDKTSEVNFLEDEIKNLQRKLTKKDAELSKQERELHKLKVRQFFNNEANCLVIIIFFQSVLQQASSLMSGDDHLLTTIQEPYSMAGQLALTKKQGVSGQSVDPAKKVHLNKIEKDFRYSLSTIIL